MAKSILITGASTGIGAEAAQHLAPGNRVFVHYNASKDKAEEVARRIEELNGEAELEQADLSTREGCAKLADAVSMRWGHLDVLVNNAGALVQRRAARDIDWDLLERVFALNVFSTMLMSSLCIPLLEKGTSPCIINISSIAARHGGPTATPYAAAKGAIDTFTRGLATELAPRIRVNAIAPGVILTPLHANTEPARLKAWEENTPLRMHGRARHIAMAMPLLIENDFMTGETIDINGGSRMR